MTAAALGLLMAGAGVRSLVSTFFFLSFFTFLAFALFRSLEGECGTMCSARVEICDGLLDLPPDGYKVSLTSTGPSVVLLIKQAP